VDGRWERARQVDRRWWPPAGYPTLDQIRAWIKVPATAIPDDQLQQVVDAEAGIQARLCRIPTDTYPPELCQALYRRVQRHIAAKAVALGLVGLDQTEYGPVRVPGYDAEVNRLEASLRIPVIA
jgi:hypothetical protein